MTTSMYIKVVAGTLCPQPFNKLGFMGKTSHLKIVLISWCSALTLGISIPNSPWHYLTPSVSVTTSPMVLLPSPTLLKFRCRFKEQDYQDQLKYVQMNMIGDGYAMYWFKPIEIHSTQFWYLYT